VNNSGELIAKLFAVTANPNTHCSTHFDGRDG
jgi:hypothetical protein